MNENRPNFDLALSKPTYACFADVTFKLDACLRNRKNRRYRQSDPVTHSLNV